MERRGVREPRGVEEVRSRGGEERRSGGKDDMRGGDDELEGKRG